MKKKIKHAVVLLNYNGVKDTLDCLASIYTTKDTPHIIVVDNGSSDDSIKQLKATYPNLDLIASPTNLGFAGGNNLGIKRALAKGAQVVYLLNNDTLVDPNLFFRSYRSVAGKDVIEGAKIYYAKGYEYHETQRGQGDILWYAGGIFDWGSVTMQHLGVDQEDQGQFDLPTETLAITGCFMAIPRRAIKKIGYLESELFLYLEDAEYCLRAQKAGIKLRYNPKLIVYHKNSQTSGVGSPIVDYYLTRNRFYIAKKYGSQRLLLALIKEALTRNWKLPLRKIAFFDFLWGRMGNRNETISSLVAKPQK